jgi:hypothetical protein
MNNSTNNRGLVPICAIAVALLVATSPAMAWDGIKSGTVQTIQVAAGNNYGFRVFVGDSSSMCTGGPTWAYLNEADSNYKTYVAAILTAKASGTPVTIYSTLEGTYCHIGFVTT